MYISSNDENIIFIIEGGPSPIQLEFEQDQALLILDQLITEINLIAHRATLRRDNLIIFRKDGELTCEP